MTIHTLWILEGSEDVSLTASNTRCKITETTFNRLTRLLVEILATNVTRHSDVTLFVVCYHKYFIHLGFFWYARHTCTCIPIHTLTCTITFWFYPSNSIITVSMFNITTLNRFIDTFTSISCTN